MKEHAVGSFVIDGREVYKVVLDNVLYCSSCDCNNYDSLCLGPCDRGLREDGKDIIYVLFDTIPEDEEPYDLESL